MKTALEIAMQRAESLHPIPLMTDLQGRYWSQPARGDIEIDATHALMSAAAFGKLPEYSSSMPSGVYPGKCWRRHDGIFDHSQPRKIRWLLVWYGPDVNGRCAILFREILLTDGELPK